MLDMIQSGYNALKGVGDIAQGFIALKTETAKNQAIIDIQRHVLEAQRALTEADFLHQADLKCIDEFEREKMRLEEWSVEKERYELKRYFPGTFAYAVKATMAGTEPPHMLCAPCYQNGRKSIMQAMSEIRGGKRMHLCPTCKLATPIGLEMAGTSIGSEPAPKSSIVVFESEYDHYDDL